MRYLATASALLLALAGCSKKSSDDGPPPLTVTISPATNQKILVNANVNFSATVVDGTGPWTYLWTFGSAHADVTVEDPGNIQFTATGTYLVTFTATDSTGRAGSASVSITVNTVLASIDLPASNPTIYRGGQVNFTGSATGSGPFTYAWTFLGGTPPSSTAQNPGNVTYNAVGVFTATLIVTGSGGATDTDTVTVTVLKTLISIDITPTSYDLIQGQYVDYTVTANFSDGPAVDVTSSATITSGDLTRVTMSGNRATAVVGPTTATVTITASYTWDVLRQDTATINTLSGTRYTISQIKTQWNLLKPVATTVSYSSTPIMSVDDLGSQGQIAAQLSTDGRNWTNLYRWLAGLPANITLDATNAVRCQKGAHVLTMLNLMNQAYADPHNPPLPIGASILYQTNIYTPGEAACGESNIFRGWFSGSDTANVPTPAEFVDGWMDDFGNASTLGHRRWILHPNLKTTAFGSVWAYHTSAGHTDYSSLMHVFDTTAATPTFDYVAYPSEGFYPKQCMQDLADGDRTLWSFSANSSLYDLDGSTTVTVTRQSGGPAISITTTVLLDGYGITPSISFNPNESNLDETYFVTVNGIRRLSDNARISYSYWVNFFDVTLP